MNAKVSVIIPAYNAEEYLTECLDSALAQTHGNVELVTVNDGSVDRTGTILDDYAARYDNVKVIHTDNGGVSRARNVGLDNADGDYIMFLDSDDVIALNAVEILLRDLEDNGADIAVGLMDDKMHSSEVTCEGTSLNVWKGTEALEKSLEDSPFTYSSCAKLFKAEALHDVRFIEGRRIHEDSYFVFCSFLHEPTVAVRDIVIYRYRANMGSASHASFSDKYFDILYFAEEKRKAVEESYPELTDKAKNMLVKSNIAMLQCLLNTNDKRYKKDIKKCIQTVKENKRYFIPTYPGDKKRFSIIVHHLYGLFKWMYRIKYANRIKKA
ncbi:MAG: glycosyltransferase family 2 protein [Clostridia bacterium]|nr:glycosyltransferase family 2 protein [Clostridia bacterium]